MVSGEECVGGKWMVVCGEGGLGKGVFREFSRGCEQESLVVFILFFILSLSSFFFPLSFFEKEKEKE
jgi:hypothetical protein